MRARKDRAREGEDEVKRGEERVERGESMRRGKVGVKVKARERGAREWGRARERGREQVREWVKGRARMSTSNDSARTPIRR